MIPDAIGATSVLVTSGGLSFLSGLVYRRAGGAGDLGYWTVLPVLFWPLWGVSLGAATYSYYLHARRLPALREIVMLRDQSHRGGIIGEGQLLPRDAVSAGACDDSCMRRLDVIGVIVSDMDRAIDFYRRLGLEFPANPDPEGHGHVETVLRGGLRFTLDTEETIRSFDPDWMPPSGGHRVGIAFLCESPDDVDRTHGALVGAGAKGHKEPWDAFWGQRYAQVRDPDGNVIDLFAPLQGGG